MIDAQIGHEKTMTSLLPAVTGCNILYGMGMIELGITMSYDQLVIDAEIARMNKRILQGIPVDEDTLAVDLIHRIGPGGNYLAEEHTIKYLRQESSLSTLIDRKMRPNWLEDGGKDIAARAHEKAIQILTNHKLEPLPMDVQKTIHAIIEEAERELKD